MFPRTNSGRRDMNGVQPVTSWDQGRGHDIICQFSDACPTCRSPSTQLASSRARMSDRASDATGNRAAPAPDSTFHFVTPHRSATMSRPQYAPETLPIQLSPGGSAEGSVSLTAPVDGGVTAAIAGGDALVFVEAVTGTRYEWRDGNADEQVQRGPIFGGGGGKQPPVMKILVPVDLGMTDGAVPLAVPAGSTVKVTVKATVPAGHAEGLYTATLTISGSTWDPITVA